MRPVEPTLSAWRSSFASLSLGIDLGFGQPMEHVLRQCLIGVRIAGALGLGGDLEAATYCTGLLVNVGCHTDAHEQAKWFGDDIAMKAKKFDHDMRSARGALSAMQDLGAGHPLLHRFKVGLEFAVGGHRDLDGMIVHHAKMTRLGQRESLRGAVRPTARRPGGDRLKDTANA